MNEPKTIARVILRSDGSVHIAFQDTRSIYATPENMARLFSDPIEFIEEGSKQYKVSTFEINRNRVPLSEVLGLTLASVNSDKQIICDFPELFQCIFTTMQTEKDKKKNLDMKYFEFENILSDEKSYLLRYYLEFSSSVKKSLLIKKNIKLRDEVQFQILREILNAFFSEELTHVPEIQDLSKHIAQAENKNVFVPASTSDDLVNTTEMARILGISPVTLKKYVKANRIKYEQKNGRYYFDRNSKPIEWDKRKGNKRKKTGEETFYRRHKGASAAEVTEHIKKLKLFTDAVAPFIRTMEELDYYVKHDYHEVCFDGRPALIIDVNPDYIHSKTGVRNRDLMKKGDAPAVPHRDKEDYVFNVHHVGQLPSSPFAIIPSYDHTGGTYTKYFHPAKVPNEDLHGPEFEAQKINFWRSYLEAYDKARIYGKISFLNSKHTKGKR